MTALPTTMNHRHFCAIVSILLSIITYASSLSVPSSTIIKTTPYQDQRPGTSGLRKKTRVWMSDDMYLSNFIQSYLTVLASRTSSSKPLSILVASDGRYHSEDAIRQISMICGANPSIISNVKVPRWGVQSTPSCSAYLRDQRNDCSAGIILTASHNPGGPDGDFGIKFNGIRGEPVDESFTEAVWEESKRLTSVNIIDSSSCPEIDLAAEPGTKFTVGGCEVEVVDPYEAYVDVLKDFFDFDVIKKFAEDGNKILFDGMHGAGGPFGKRVLGEILGFNDDCFMRCDTRPDFGGCHPDPNLTYGKELVERMGLDGKGMKTGKGEDFCLGAANDGDGDRNLICGNGVFVTPSDSLAIIADRWSDITSVGPLKGVARSMPSSGAVDVVAENNGIRNFITPTGWKFFGNLMDSEVMGGENFSPFLCGEESFGTGSSHIREKDGLWAVLAWLSILSKSPGKTVSDIVASHWGKYGRHYYARYDYEECGSEGANGMMDHLRGMVG
eukprot:CAMPEP_0118661686 /NCGR_PEP_ID=MMETSP0785-20121206/16425_1 /TAXON_ID=91992 /ORGANISM="Bolidomonas pacifica, Strain CCMP 1866" /LENGTH=499 /DNA_ID=CAMNT_0006555169 /DNA_START=133 /DNA_END=1628 /DNA_ORIENTATION=-